MTTYTEVDGVPTLIAPTSGPMRAGLFFRVGVADETLATSGITHLVEHLALYGHGQTDYHFNGSTGAIFTHFHMQGSEADIVAFLAGVCSGLTRLPLERLEVEKGLLRTEESSRGRGANHDMPLWRHGARDYGLPSYPEWGLNRLGPADVAQWAATWFTTQNAVLWIAGDAVPAGLRLPLPQGVRRPVPDPSSALPQTPAYFTGDAGRVVFDTVLPRHTTSSLYAKVLERALFRELRQEGGYSYTATTAYDPRGDGYAVVTALADALPEKQGAVLGGFVDVLAALRAGRVDPADLAAVRGQAEERLRHPDIEVARLPGLATDLLCGRPARTVEELRAELAAVTVDDVVRAAGDAVRSGLLMVPEGHSADWAGFAAAPTRSAQQVPGHRFAARSGSGAGLFVGPEGVGIGAGEDQVAVRYADCAVMLAWPDGGRQLIGHDGIVVRVEPTLWVVPPQELAAIDATVPPQRTVPMPARSPDAVPQPRPRSASAPAPRPAAPQAAKPSRAGLWLTLVGVGLIMLFLLCCSGAELLVVTDDTGTVTSFDWQFAVVVWIVTLAAAVGFAVLVRRRLRR